MAPFLEEWSKYSSVRTAEQNREFILNAAKLARTLRLEDLFAEELKDIRYSDGFMTLKKFLADEKDPALLKLNAKFCSDFMLENPTTEPLDNVRLGILAKFGAFTAKGIINRDNYPEAARQYMNTFRAFERGILQNDRISNYDKQRLADKVFAPEMSCVDGRYELKNNVGASRYEFDLGDDIAVVVVVVVVHYAAGVLSACRVCLCAVLNEESENIADVDCHQRRAAGRLRHRFPEGLLLENSVAARPK